jgi:RIO kinase 1
MVTLTYQERFKTIKGVFDEFTNRTLFDLQKKGVFDELVSPLEVGKESNVFVGNKGKKKVIIKIYRMQTNDFKRMYDYIRKDTRYQFLRKKRREIILAWTQREFKNLLRAEKGKVKSPHALGWKNNIIVEEFIGNKEAAPPLKDAYPAYPHQFLQDIITEMKKMYKVKLIHGDLSSFNILNHNEKPVLIDFSQATLTKTPNSEELLVRDVKNILKFFKKLGVEESFEKVMKEITKP